jgi:hypothetical protein
MKRKKLHIGLTLLTYLLSGGVGGSSRLCIGADGHMEIESGNARCCPEDNNTAPAEQEHPCGTCLHIPLLTEHVQPKNAKTPTLSPGPEQAIFSPWNGVAEMVRMDSPYRTVYLIEPGEKSINHLQSIILLC